MFRWSRKKSDSPKIEITQAIAKGAMTPERQGYVCSYGLEAHGLPTDIAKDFCNPARLRSARERQEPTRTMTASAVKTSSQEIQGHT